MEQISLEITYFLSERAAADHQQFIRGAGDLQADHGDSRYVQPIEKAFIPRPADNTVQKLRHPESDTLSVAPDTPARLPAETVEESPFGSI